MPASRHRRRKFVSYLLIAAGMVMLFLGGRDVVEARLGQSEAARAFEEPELKPSPFIRAGHTKQTARPQLALGEAIAKLTIPRLNVNLYVVEGDGARQLRSGPGHVTGTAMPGQGGNCIIAGHRDTHFRGLKDIRKGDRILIQTRAGEYTYRVSGMEVVEPSNTSPLKATRDAELSLVTCYPFYYLGSAPKRFIVQAQLEKNLEAAQARVYPAKDRGLE